MSDRLWDAIIVGAGPAGLSAALVLGRCNRRVLVCDAGRPRSRASRRMHAFLTRDGIPPADFLRLARHGVQRYPNVRFRRDEVVDAVRTAEGSFSIVMKAGGTARSRKLLLATGVVDELPRLRGIGTLYGASVFHCPYCDGWEIRGTPVAVYGQGRRGYEMARAMTAWASDIALCSDGPSGLSPLQRRNLGHNGVRLYESRIARLTGRGGRLESVVFRDGQRLRRSVLFFDTPSHARSMLASALGCQFNSNGGIKCAQYEAASVPGVYAAGNVIRDVQLSIVAAAEGAKAAFGINRALTREDFTLKATGAVTTSHPGMD